MIKIYTCKRCGFKGIRKVVRKHLRDEHFVKGLSLLKTSGKTHVSRTSNETKSEEFK